MTETREPIERIRAEVEEVRREHDGQTFCRSSLCAPGVGLPCPALRLAEKVLKLTGALEATQRFLDHAHSTARASAPWTVTLTLKVLEAEWQALERVLIEVAGEERSDG